MRWVFVAAFALGGCPGPSDPSPDGPINNDLGVHLAWKTQHPTIVPGPAKGSVNITSATFNLSNMRLVGDAGPGDSRTQLSQLSLAWSEGVAPMSHAFVDAPPGIYSRVVFELEPEAGVAFEITGTTKIQNVDTPFRIVDGANMNNISVGHKRATLPPGGKVDMAVRLDFEEVVNKIDLNVLELVEGVLLLDENDAQIDEVRRVIHDDLFGEDDDD